MFHAKDIAHSLISDVVAIEVVADSIPTTLLLDASLSATAVGTPVVFKGTVIRSVMSPSAYTSSVKVKDQAGVIVCAMAISIDGHGECSIPFATAGTKTLTAHYEGNNTYAPSDSTSVSIVVTGPPSSLALSPVNASVAKGSTVQLSVIAKDSAGNIVPTPAGLRWTGDSKASVDQNGLVTANLAGDAVVRVTDPISMATAQVTVNVYGLTPFMYYAIVRYIKCGGESVTLAYSMNGGGDSFGENFSYTSLPCTSITIDSFGPRLGVPINLRANTRYTLTMTAAGSSFVRDLSYAFVEFDSTLLGVSGFVHSGSGVPGTYTVDFTTPP
jgi:hypothetical protein